jgi:hypothetical protein
MGSDPEFMYIHLCLTSDIGIFLFFLVLIYKNYICKYYFTLSEENWMYDWHFICSSISLVSYWDLDWGDFHTKEYM